MKKFHLLYTLSILFFVASKAQNIKLIDINKMSNSYPRNNEYSAKNIYTYLNGYSYFTADDGIHGRELWKTNGTNAGTQLVKDINPGAASSNDDNTNPDITASGNKVFFVADGGVGAFGLWASDGTSNGTHFVGDFSYGAGVYPSYLTDVNGSLFFALSYYDFNYYTYVNQVWKIDNNEQPILIADLTGQGENIQQLKNVNGKLFFTFYNYSSGYTLYETDGSIAGSYSVVGSYFYNAPLQLTASNNQLYFIADNGSGSTVWVSDGTYGGTYGINNNGINCIATSDAFNRDTFAIVNNVLYFRGTTYDAGNELCKYDEANPSAGVTMVKDIQPGYNSSYPSFLTNVNGELFFTIGPAGLDAELWKTDGTDAGTKLVKDINPGGNNFYYGLTNLNGTLVFAFGQNASGFDLWKSSGSAAGTKLVKDINPSVNSSFPQYLTASNGLLLFGANDGINGFELWKSDGSTTGTKMIKDINHTTTNSSYPFGFTETPTNVLFSASTENSGRELWGTDGTDGTDAGTAIVKDIYSGFNDANPSYFTKLKNKTYFFANDSSGMRMYSTDGTKSGTALVPTGLDHYNGYIMNVLAGNNLFYVIAYSYNSYNAEIWRSDGTTQGTFAVKTDAPDYYNIDAVVINDRLYFSSDDNSGFYGNELWKSDGTVASTALVKDIYPGSSGSYPSNLFKFKGKLYFTAYDGNAPYGTVLWTSDGTDAGTKIVKSIYVNNVSFAKTNNKFFFSAENAVSKGYELYASDGTPGGTKLIKDIATGPNSSGISMLTSGDSLIYFVADDGINGSELWRSNGTSSGTFMVKDITPGSDGTFMNDFLNVYDKLVFLADDKLWYSDGTDAGTQPVNDTALDNISQIDNLAFIKNHLYFTGYTYATGDEMYVADVPASAQSVTVQNVTATKLNNTFFAKLLSNPVTDLLRININSKNQQAIQTIIIDAAGKTILSDKKLLVQGDNFLSYNVNSWTSGLYIIKIVSTGGCSATLKAVK